jgi:hypothetical protein
VLVNAGFSPIFLLADFEPAGLPFFFCNAGNQIRATVYVSAKCGIHTDLLTLIYAMKFSIFP